MADKVKFMDEHGGTVSHATMRSEDIGPAFLSKLEELNPDAARKFKRDYRNAVRRDFREGKDPEDTGFAIEALFEALNAEAPEGVYFGANEGDGSDYGFWEVLES